MNNSKLTPKNAQALFKQLMQNTSLNTTRAYVEVVTPHGCQIYIPCASNEEDTMKRTKEFYQELVDIADF